LQHSSLYIPYFKSVLAKGAAQLGDLAAAIALVDEAIAQIERPGWEERCYYTELLRLKGWMLSLKCDAQGAERAYIASLDWARQQQAKSWELRTATSYARLLRDQGRAREAHDLLAPIYGWFTEGFDTKDLKDAKALLAELTDPLALAASGGLAAAGAGVGGATWTVRRVSTADLFPDGEGPLEQSHPVDGLALSNQCNSGKDGHPAHSVTNGRLFSRPSRSASSMRFSHSSGSRR
jgi:hypothetical protein